MIDSARNTSRITMGMAIKEVLVIALIVLAYVVDVPVIILIGFALACLLVGFSNCEDSVYFLAFFTSFSGIFVYEGRHMFFVMVALFIIKFFLCNKISYKTIIYYLVIIVYSLLFCDVQGDFSFAKLIGLILLFAVPVVGAYADRINCETFMKHYIFGFVLQTVMGFFVTKIPAMLELFETDLMWTADYQELTRFFGLAFDSNFYALSNFIIVGYLLFAFKKLTIYRGIILLFLGVSGFLTISKSYVLIVGVFLIIFVVIRLMLPKRLLFAIVGVVVAVFVFLWVSDSIGYNAIDLVLSRFVWGGGFAENTTGRVGIWKEYLDIFMHANLKEFLFGFGFNATVKQAAHNTFIEFLFYYGLIGFGIWVQYFWYCAKMFVHRTTEFSNKTPIVLLSFVIGCSFLSAYTYEAFWIGLVISFITLGKSKRISG